MRVAILACALAGCGDNTRHVVSIDARPLPDTSTSPDAARPGMFRGTFELAYYYLTAEADYTGTADTAVYDPSCTLLAMVTAQFAAALEIERTGKLADGRVLGYAAACSC